MRLRILATGVLSVVFAAGAFAAVCDPNDGSLLKPDLVAQAPSQVRVLTRGLHQQLTFTTTVANVGDGPLVLGGGTISGPTGFGFQVTQEIQRADGTTCTHVVGFFPYRGEGGAFRIDDFAEYQLRQDDPFTGPIVASFSKAAFCFRNSVQLRGAPRAQEEFNCSDGSEGISVGFADEELGQLLNLDAVAPGEYFLVIVVNPNGAILEKSSDTAEDAGVASVVVGRSHLLSGPRPQPTRRPVHGQPPPASTPTPPSAPPPTATPASGRPVHPSRPSMSLPHGHEGCGGHQGKSCSAGDFCEFAENRCGIAWEIGVCTPMPQQCGPEAAPVCGCDGVTYGNDCQRQRAGVSPAHRGPC